MECPACGEQVELVSLPCSHQLCQDCIEKLKDEGPCPLHKLCDGLGLLSTRYYTEDRKLIETPEEALVSKRAKLEALITQTEGRRKLWSLCYAHQEYKFLKSAFLGREPDSSHLTLLKQEEFEIEEDIAFRIKCLESNIETIEIAMAEKKELSVSSRPPITFNVSSPTIEILQEILTERSLSRSYFDINIFVGVGYLQLHKNVGNCIVLESNVKIIRLPTQPLAPGKTTDRDLLWIYQSDGYWSAIGLKEEVCGQKIFAELPVDLQRLNPIEGKAIVAGHHEYVPGVQMHTIYYIDGYNSWPSSRINEFDAFYV